MPLYEYICRSCRHPFEAIVFTSDTPACPKCESTDLEKQLSAFAVGGEPRAEAPRPGPCASCGDPRGPGGCGMMRD